MPDGIRTVLLLTVSSVAVAVGVLGGCVADEPAAATGKDASSDDGAIDAASDAGTDAPGSAACPYAAAVLADNPRHYFRFRLTDPKLDEIVPNNANAARFAGKVLIGKPAALSCDDEGAVQLGGGGDAVVLDPNASFYEFSGTAPFTVELWFAIAAVPSNERFQRLFAREAVDATQGEYRTGYSMALDPSDAGGVLSFERFNGPQGDASAQDNVHTTVTTPSKYHHAVATYAGSGQLAVLYLDGAAVTSSTTKITVQPNAFATMIGARAMLDGAVGDGDFVGMIDEVAIYDYPLSPARVKAHFQAK